MNPTRRDVERRLDDLDGGDGEELTHVVIRQQRYNPDGPAEPWKRTDVWKDDGDDWHSETTDYRE